MAKKVRRFVDPSLVGTRSPDGSQHVYAGMKDADWDCNSCGTKNIKATTKVCSNCGHPKDASEGYHSPSTPRPYLSEKDMEDRGIDLERQKDEECPHCNSRLTSKTEVCPNCGANIEKVYKADRICPSCKRESNKRTCESCGTATVLKSKLQTIPRASVEITPAFIPATKNIKNYHIVGGILVVLFLCIFGLISFFKPKVGLGTVTGNSWSCSVPLIENQYNYHEDWTLPQDADLIKSYEKFHYNKQVEDGYKEVCEDKWEVVGSHDEPKTKNVCTGGEYIDTTETCDDETNVCTYDKNYAPITCSDVPDGTEKINDYGWVEHCEDKMQYKDVPVNDIFYEYNIWEWVAIDPATLTGTGNVITCPVVNESETIRQNGNPEISCMTSFLVGEKYYDYQPDCTSEFSKFIPGSKWQTTRRGPVITEVDYLP